MRVEVKVVEVDDAGDSRSQPGVCVTCQRCSHRVVVAGRSERSIKRGCATLRDECPEGEENFYFDPDA